MSRLGLSLLVWVMACADSHHASDGGVSGGGDTAVGDVGPAPDALTERLRLTEPLGSCDAEEQARCGCIGGLRRCDTCTDRCPTGSACDENAAVCRRRDLPTGTDYDGSTWDDGCSVVVTDGRESPEVSGWRLNPESHYCHTGKVCGASPEDDGSVFSHMSGLCYPVSFCQAAARAEPPVETLRCVYSDGSDVLDGPSTSAGCPLGDPREPFCGGACGDDLRCPRYPEILLGPDIRPGPPQACVGFSETRSFGVCAWGSSRCSRGNDEDNSILLGWCATGYGQDCSCLVTHPQVDESRWLQGYVVLASVCRDYHRRFPDSTECVDAHWAPIP